MSKQEKTPWWRQGKTPDYRFSLANERTFLAWIRTALAFLAGAVAIDQFTVHLASPMVRQGLALLLIAGAALLGVQAYRRWAGNEKAMRRESDMPYTPMLLTVTLFITVIAAALAAIIILD
ncbi:DUF202 domain-containing protein [Brenneria populi]|uniref:DUF202 domain-containing protein n=1 Tax=Brenneria populi TaxID=1505588 RepID=A0ABU6JSX8_9GAMM|nr:DUF202 domain-containing protein [Brenneria populi Li et al. 2015]